MTSLDDYRATQRRSVALLSVGQVLGGLGLGAGLSLGAIIAAELSGSPAWSGMAATMTTLGAAAAAIPLARLARARGRRVALTVGALVAALGAVVTITSVVVDSFPLLLLALALLGSGTAVALQSRFAATDLASSKHRARDLSLVVWATSLGAIVGPNLVGPGESVGAALGLPPLAGSFVFTVVAQIVAAVVYVVGLRPDPLLLRQELDAAPATPSSVAPAVGSPRRAAFAITAVALSHAVMVSVMSMTPVHLSGHGSSITIIGLVISLHIAGMYLLSPVFGALADRAGRVPVILLGQGIFVAALVTVAVAADSQTGVTVGLVLLGLGWSASTVAGSALLAESVAAERRSILQGRSDLAMNIAGALGGALAGPVLALLGYSGLASLALVIVTVTVVLAIRLRLLSRR
ncbi:MFS transporter [Conyzicola nivalis]|uniref:MFS transporter n=1 Tax=Conyzicola nivalis TaxID=1477021 RepID=A0A916SJ66_9MICO|nr:MFS transporter [Conyzicola nivalis]GGB02038.1 MFS transporter [Conyzicola nivalis]